MSKQRGKLFSAVFGRLQWNSPPWLYALRHYKRTSPKMFWGAALLFTGLFAGIAFGVHYYQHLPKPQYTLAQIQIPVTTPREEPYTPQNLIIDFGIKENGFLNKSVAPLNLVGKEITAGVTMSPDIKGTWTWSSDSELTFTPAIDWPAGQEYRVNFSHDFFAPHAQLESYTLKFKTLEFLPVIKEFKLYQNPDRADQREAVATLEFNYPVDAESLQQKTSLSFQDQQKNQSGSGQPLSFKYTFSEDKREAYLHSRNIEIKDVARFLNLNIHEGVLPAQGQGHKKALHGQILIPDSSQFFKVSAVDGRIVRNPQNKPEQVITIETSVGINEQEFNRGVHLYLLPQDKPASGVNPVQKNYDWKYPGEVTAPILALAKPLQKELLPSEQNYATLHTLKIKAPAPGYILVQIDKGIQSIGNFKLATEFRTILPIPQLPQEISFLHQGSLLALGNEQKLSVLVRGLTAVKFDFARVLPENVNQLITQTQGDFNDPRFINPSFNQQNISEITSEIREFDAADPAKEQYTALDFNKYLTHDPNSSGPQGLFLLQATGWDKQNNSALDARASRLILITDMAMVVKRNIDQSQTVYVGSITQGAPVAQAKVTVIGKNGLPVVSQVTNDQGEAAFPALNDYIEDQEPVAFLAQKGEDVSFIPFNNSNRQLNLSKFDIDGVYADATQGDTQLRAYLFSDRGIYRPGDSVHLGIIVKQAYARPQPAGLPLQLSITDARGTVIANPKIILNDSGLMEYTFTTQAHAPTGQYTADLYLTKEGEANHYLGSTSIRIGEFLPDRMRISSSISPKPPTSGWSLPNQLQGQVALWNLYGAPAVNRLTNGKIILIPQKVAFDEYPDYIFADPLNDPKKGLKTFTENLGEQRTNSEGKAVFPFNLDKYEQATYQLRFITEGFEADGGRSVTSQTETLVSPLPYFIGYKPDGDLAFIKQNDKRSVHYLAVDPELHPLALEKLHSQLFALQPVNTLIKKSDGTYQYQSIIQTKLLQTAPFSLTAQGAQYELNTANIGDYQLNIIDEKGTVLSQLKYSVAGTGAQSLTRNAELSVKLDKAKYKAGETVQLHISAPYTGSGLITVERDKVYYAQWFKTDTTSSVQSITIPAELQGNAYINVAFMRDWNSPELFISPLSYSVTPFKINNQAHNIAVNLQAPKLTRPGETLKIGYSSDKTGKIIVFAVDQGILQVAHYSTPNPLAYFFQKYALQVLTQQTVDQIMPKFIQARELSAVGGDGADEALASHLNPFKRKTDLPVVFWSGIQDTDSTVRELDYPIPDYFNGSIRVMAVAVANDAVGAQEQSVTVRGDFVINPNVPTFVAPGDEFTVSAAIANNIPKSAGKLPVQITITPSAGLEVIGKTQDDLSIAEGQEQIAHFRLKAGQNLGPVTLNIEAQSGDKVARINSSLSIRPASPLITRVNSGVSQDKQRTLEVMQSFYPEHHQVSASLSTSPLVLVFGLQRYLDNYPYGCTEQLTSKALPLLAMNNHTGFAVEQEQVKQKVTQTLQMLSQRQMTTGAFSYWPTVDDNPANQFASLYAMHFITEARAQGYLVPDELLNNGLGYLKNVAGTTPTSLADARLVAYAIYLLTRNEIVTTNYITQVQTWLDKNSPKKWQEDLTAVYLAGAYQLLQNSDEANRLIAAYRPLVSLANSNDFFNQNTADAQYLYIVAKHFPNMLTQVSNKVLPHMVDAMNEDDINTVLSGYISMALAAYPEQQLAADGLSMTKIMNQGQAVPVPIAGHTSYQHTALEGDIQKIQFDNPQKHPFYYQLLQSGFNQILANKSVSQGLEVFREYRNAAGKVVHSARLGEELEVHIQLRSTKKDYLNNIVVEDLLPGGFEPVADSVLKGSMDFADMREDRVNFFGTAEASTKELIYKIKATNVGKYTVPAISATSMYIPSIRAQGVHEEIEIHS